MNGTIEFDAQRWLSDPRLRECSRADRGTLIDIMALASTGIPYGYLIDSSGIIPDGTIARTFGMDIAEWLASKAALAALGRIVVTDLGAIYVPRMVKDGIVYEQQKECGKIGGNPKITKTKHERCKPITVEYYLSKLPESHRNCVELKQQIEEWHEYRQRRRIVLTTAAVDRQVSQLSPLSPVEAARWLRCAIDRQWRGIYPPPANWTDPIAIREKQAKMLQEERRKRLFDEAVQSVLRELKHNPNDDRRILSAARDKYEDLGTVEGMTVVEAILETRNAQAEIRKFIAKH